MTVPSGTSTPLATGIDAGVGMTNADAIVRWTSGPVAPESGPMVTLLLGMAISSGPSAPYTPFRNDAANTAVTSKSTVKLAPAGDWDSPTGWR